MFEMHAISKSYGGAVALRDVDFAAADAEVHALLGMNGAGKSTLVKIMVGVERRNSGSMTMDRVPLDFTSAREAADLGIAVVAQDLNVFDQLTVLANMFINREPRRFGVLDLRTMRERAHVALVRVGMDADPGRIVATLSQADKQRLAIARALLLNPKVLVLDEPTSALQPRETERLLELVRSLREHGTAIVYVSHFLQEVFSVADRITVLRDGGVVVPGVPAGQTSLPEIVRAMAGDAESAVEIAPEAGGPTDAQETHQRLVVDDLGLAGTFQHVSFVADGGTIFGVAGLEGSGARELLATLFGATRATTGTAHLSDGLPIGISMPNSVHRGVAYVPADRLASGVMPRASILDNLAQVRIAALGHGPFFLTRKNLAKRAIARVGQLGIKVGGLDDPLTSLSGGNQQKVLIGKWLEADATVYLFDDPTASVDVHARADIHAIIRALAAAGNVVVLASTDMPELIELSDRIAVMHQGSLAAVLDNDDLTAQDLLEAVNMSAVPH